MEGKALLFKYLGGVDAVPICLASKNADEIVRTVELLAPSFGGINLEDIAQPKCFRILERLRGALDIPVWHDDQQGTATVLLAGLLNALEVVGKDIGRVRIAMIGMGPPTCPTTGSWSRAAPTRARSWRATWSACCIAGAPTSRNGKRSSSRSGASAPRRTARA